MDGHPARMPLAVREWLAEQELKVAEGNTVPEFCYFAPQPAPLALAYKPSHGGYPGTAR